MDGQTHSRNHGASLTGIVVKHWKHHKQQEQQNEQIGVRVTYSHHARVMDHQSVVPRSRSVPKASADCFHHEGVV